MLLLYDVGYVNENVLVYIANVMMTTYDISCMKQNITHGLLSCLLVYVGLWGFT